MHSRRIVPTLLGLAALAVFAWLSFQPRVANHFGYALPIRNGLPCRLHYRARDYENDHQCGGMNQSAWSLWYAAHHRVPSGGPCEQPASLQRIPDWPLHQVASISALLGAPHPVLVGNRNGPGSGFTMVVLYVGDGRCYRPYVLSGGP